MAGADLADGRLMRLGVSSAAAPDAQIDELVEACRRRGLGALELREGDGHDVAFDGTSRATDVVCGIVPHEVIDVHRLAAASQMLAAPVIVAGDATTLAERVRTAREIIDAGGRALPLMRGGARDWLDVVSAHAVEYAWEIDPRDDDVVRDSELVLSHAGRPPAYIRFIGGGPETTMQDGRGIGTLISRLAVEGYRGPLVMVPSTLRYRTAWASWLGRHGGSGCGSRADGGAHIPVL